MESFPPMRLTELISFARQINLSPNIEHRQRNRGPLREPQPDVPGGERLRDDDPNAVPIQRQPVPTWLTDSVRIDATRDVVDVILREGGKIVLSDGGNIVLRVEQEISPSDLPRDLGPKSPIDTLAYYLPFHLHGANWGIYVRESGILFAATIMKGSALSPSDALFIDLGHQLLLDHERLHFRAEVACARAAVIAGYRLYDIYFSDGFATAHEEALANALAFRLIRRARYGIQSRVTTWMKSQGPGYCDFERWGSPAKFEGGCRLASQHMLKRLLASSLRQPAEFLFDSIRFKAPIYMVLDVSSVTALKPFPKKYGIRVFVHVRDEHPPPHIHIHIPPERPRTKYIWPDLRPVEGEPELSSHERATLDEYLAEYGSKIDAKVRAVFSEVGRGRKR